MSGSSWTGVTQIGVASFRPRGLDAITPFHIATDIYRDVAYPCGVYNARFMNWYAADVVEVDAQAAGGVKRDVSVLGCQSWQDGLVSSRATELYYDTFNRGTSWFIGLNGQHGNCEFTRPSR
jgi:predicted acyl esterase